MKTLKFFIVLVIIFAFSTNSVNSQKVTGEQIVSWIINPTDVPCLTEFVYGNIVEHQSFTNKTYHVNAEGVLKGVMSGDEYIIDYNYNSFWKTPGTFHFVLPMRIRHDGELIAVINWTFHVVFDGQGVEVFGRNLNVVNCK
jgi:hypothetical protein